MMKSDLRDTSSYLEAEVLYERLRRPGTGQISDAAEIHASPDGKHGVFAGTILDKLEGMPPTRICRVDLTSGDVRVLTFGPNTDRLPKFSPDGKRVAFLSDRHQAGDFQLYLLDPESGVVQKTLRVDGWVEYLHWSPDGKKILLGVAGHGADVAGGQGAVASKQVIEDRPAWMPLLKTGDESYSWRRAWVYSVSTAHVRPASDAGINIWEAVWCGNDAIAAVASPGPSEGLWYTARLHVLQVETGSSREVYVPRDQLGWPAASPSGTRLAIVEAICSDRWVVAGNLQLIEPLSGAVRGVPTRGVDITYTEWLSENQLLLAGQRGLESVFGVYDVGASEFKEIWASSDITTGGFGFTVVGCKAESDCVLVGEGFLRAPEIAVILRGQYRTVKSFDFGYSEQAKVIRSVERLGWRAPDGLEIQGWLLRPHGKAPFPLVMQVHGGPVSHWRPAWLGRGRATVLMLLERGYAVFLPNPRGSSGRGQDFVRYVLGDLGGADTFDLLSGIDHLVANGVADPSRLGVTGVSYGGFMTTWLISQDSRFAAAVPVAPHTNQVTQHLISNIPHFARLFLADHYANAGGKYFQRSAIMHAHKVRTPTLNVCGALDRCTPPEEAVQFHNALLGNGVRSVLVNYPEEGHGIRNFPALIDYAARVMVWFDEHLRSDKNISGEQEPP